MKGKTLYLEMRPRRVYIPPMAEVVDVEEEVCMVTWTQQGVEGEHTEIVPGEGGGEETEWSAKSNNSAIFFDDEDIDVDF